MFIHESLYIYYATNTWWVDLVATIYVANFYKYSIMKRILRRGERKLELQVKLRPKLKQLENFHSFSTLFFGFDYIMFLMYPLQKKT